ncbi:hypothetical protein ACT6QH_14380 [Xanthobacter sp. TB0139]|uniref:hypothetical protein n=1 Tax=Xanthobacter sp. TB0139 TaxID=3459178 RepID=UPI004039CD2B
MAGQNSGRVNWGSVVSVGSATILVLTQVVALAVAAGWALGGLLNIGNMGEMALMALFTLLALYGSWRYFRLAVVAEPLRYPG